MKVVWRSSWQLGKTGDPHTKPFFFPVVFVATSTDSHLEVDQRIRDRIRSNPQHQSSSNSCSRHLSC
ncbi:hypothetical protein Taro_054969 [Colocasia esculenta]|uniref:Uncharacterized protein n=1 Tax=Colocasia esculenta TaxID=4460 RepID=A0A843XS21_COLES|nr:hypothetical protein [Colocasia esculenta]